MSVVIETTLGDLTVDLYLKERPNTCLNFLKLCKIRYYNLCVFHKVERGFIAQTGDPTSTGRGGESVFSHLYGDQAAYFDAELKPRLKHEKLGTLSMVNNGNNMNGSQFFLTLGENISYLDEVHTVFGEVVEGFETLLKIGEAICDPNNRPYQDIRITHTVVLHDPYDDPNGLQIPDSSPIPTKEQLESGYIGADEEIDDTKGKDTEEIEEKIKESEAKARATILEMVGDIPDADVKPPENVLFVCKLNPVTTSEDLEIIFSRFGTIMSCEVIKDKKSGESLQYAFIEFEKEEDCENAYFKMDNVLIDDRRIHVDFSQSVSKIYWDVENNRKGKGMKSQNFSIKGTNKKSDGYEMIFDMDIDSPNIKAKQSNKPRSPDRRYKQHNVDNRIEERNYERSYHDSFKGKKHDNHHEFAKRKNKDRLDLSNSMKRDKVRHRERKNTSRSCSPKQRAVDKVSETRRRNLSSDSDKSEKYHERRTNKQYSKAKQRHDSSSSEDTAYERKLKTDKYSSKSSDSVKQAYSRKSYRAISPSSKFDKRRQGSSIRHQSRSSDSSSPKGGKQKYSHTRKSSSPFQRQKYGSSLSTTHKSRRSDSPSPKRRTREKSDSMKSRSPNKYRYRYEAASGARHRSMSSEPPSPKRTTKQTHSRASRSPHKRKNKQLSIKRTSYYSGSSSSSSEASNSNVRKASKASHYRTSNSPQLQKNESKLCARQRSSDILNKTKYEKQQETKSKHHSTKSRKKYCDSSDSEKELKVKKSNDKSPAESKRKHSHKKHKHRKRSSS